MLTPFSDPVCWQLVHAACESTEKQRDENAVKQRARLREKFPNDADFDEAWRAYVEHTDERFAEVLGDWLPWLMRHGLWHPLNGKGSVLQ
jgi:hypothetical protein